MWLYYYILPTLHKYNKYGLGARRDRTDIREPELVLRVAQPGLLGTPQAWGPIPPLVESYPARTTRKQSLHAHHFPSEVVGRVWVEVCPRYLCARGVREYCAQLGRTCYVSHVP